MQLQILIIDDDYDEVLIFQQLISDLAYQIECTYAEGAEDALALLKTISPDIIFLDVNMPKINGIECLSMIRHNPDLRHIPVVIYSNGINKNMMALAENIGAAACFKKMGDFDMMKAELKEILEKNFTLGRYMV